MDSPEGCFPGKHPTSLVSTPGRRLFGNSAAGVLPREAGEQGHVGPTEQESGGNRTGRRRKEEQDQGDGPPHG
jgi:hypothetical protein